MKSDFLELAKVTLAGTGGYVATISLADVATLGSIGVAVVTIVYVSAKLYYLIKYSGRNDR